MVKKIQNNYIGYNDKITLSNRDAFNVFTDSLQNLAKNAEDYQCLPIFRKWLSYFNDKHVSVTYDDSSYDRNKIREYYSKEEKTEWSENSLNTYLLEKRNILDSLEGVWSNYTGTYKIGIVKDKKNANEFIGFIIKADGARWVSQQIKLRISKYGSEYSLKYFKASDHSINKLNFNKTTDTLTIGDGISGKWYKKMVNVTPVSTIKTNENILPRFRTLDDQTCLFEMPSYALIDYEKVIDTLINQNNESLKKCKNLIIDLRNNYGGSVLMYNKLLPYLYTNPIINAGGDVLATEDNINDYYSYIPDNVSDSIKKIFKKNLAILKSHVGEVYNLYATDTLILSKKLIYPKNISILINENTASAAELFLLQAKQSTKVKVFGNNSSGTIDYLEVVQTKMPCDFYSLNYPAARSHRLPKYPLDNIGITPDVVIPNNITDWIRYVRNYNKK